MMSGAATANWQTGSDQPPGQEHMTCHVRWREKSRVLRRGASIRRGRTPDDVKECPMARSVRSVYGARRTASLIGERVLDVLLQIVERMGVHVPVCGEGVGAQRGTSGDERHADAR